MRAWVLVLALSCALAACGGDKAPEASDRPADISNADAERSGDLVSAKAALGRAAQNAKEVDSFRGTMDMEMRFGPIPVSFDGTILYEAPDATYIEMDVLGQEMEVLSYGPRMYLRPAGEDWMSFDLSAIGVDTSQFEELIENRGFFDLQELSDSVGEVQQVEDDEIDGQTYAHYRADATLADLLGELPDGLLDPAIVSQAEDFIESIEFEFWLDRDTELPRRFEMTMAMALPEGESGQMRMTFDYLSYNTPVDIPAEPVDAEPFDPDSFGG